MNWLARISASVFVLLGAMQGAATQLGGAGFSAQAQTFQVPSFSVVSFGAKCDGVTDDSAAINTTIAAAKNAIANNGIAAPGAAVVDIIFPANVKCAITNPINMTAIYGYYGITIKGGLINCRTGGKACIDALGSNALQWHNLTIYGDPANPPSYGIQIGRIAAAGTGADCTRQGFFSVNVIGYFTKAAFYNFSCEIVAFNKVNFSNQYETGAPYTLIQDGGNHFNVPSMFVTQALPVDVSQSFNENLFVNSSIKYQGQATGTPVWIGGAARHRFLSSFISTTLSNSNNAVVLWNFADGLGNLMLDFDVHFEIAPKHIFYIDGPVATPTIYGLTWSEHINQAGTSVFGRNTIAVGTVTIPNFTGKVARNLGGGSKNWFDDPTKYVLSGQVQMPTSGDFNGPPTFTGMKCIAAACAVAP